MQSLSRTLLKNIVVAAALGLAAIATWAVTHTAAPAIGAKAADTARG